MDGEGGDTEERKRVLRHASSVNRADIISKVVRRTFQGSTGEVVEEDGPIQAEEGDSNIDTAILNHVDADGLTALHYAVGNSSLDAIRILLRFGVDVTARGGAQSDHPGLTAYEMAVSGAAKEKAEEIQQIFLTEAVQAIARGDKERLRDFMDAGLDTQAGYGADSTEGEPKLSLEQWAQQLGKSDLLGELTAADRAAPWEAEAVAEKPSENGHDRGKEGATGVSEPIGGEALRDLDAEANGKPCHKEMFVEELREAIATLTAQCETLEAKLALRGTLGIIQRARSARQELMVAEQELETANDLLKKWNSAEDDAMEENGRLQTMVVEAQAAVSRLRAGKPVEPAAAAVHPANRDGPGETTADGHFLEAGSAGNGGVGVADGQDAMKANNADDRTEEGTKARSGRTTESRKDEEAGALASQLQVIAMHLEDEVQMMKELQGGEGAVGVVRRIRTLREETSLIQDNIRKTYSMARYSEARVIVLSNRGDELRSQLQNLCSYMSEPPVKPVEGTLDDDEVSMDPRPPDVADEYHGPEFDAILGSEEDDASPGQREHRVAVDDGSGERSSDGGVSGAGATRDAREATASSIVDDGTGDNDASASEQPATSRESVPSEVATGEVTRAGEPVVGDTASSHSMEPASSADLTGTVMPTAGLSEDTQPVERQAAGGSDGGATSGKGKQAQRRRGPQKDERQVTVMQEVLSSVFGWDMTASKNRKARRQGPEAGSVGSGGTNAVLA